MLRTGLSTSGRPGASACRYTRQQHAEAACAGHGQWLAMDASVEPSKPAERTGACHASQPHTACHRFSRWRTCVRGCSLPRASAARLGEPLSRSQQMSSTSCCTRCMSTSNSTGGPTSPPAEDDGSLSMDSAAASLSGCLTAAIPPPLPAESCLAAEPAPSCRVLCLSMTHVAGS